MLDHQYYGSHLNYVKETTDEELEKQNFKHCGERLSSLFEEMVYDGHPTFAEYMNPERDIVDADKVQPLLFRILNSVSF